MPIQASADGAKMVLVTTEMSPRRLLAIAAGMGDTSPMVFDDLHPGFCAAPQICISLEWALVVSISPGAAIGASREESLRAVHAVQDTDFHRPVRAGEMLTTGGEVIGLWAGRSGTNMASRLTTSDADGCPVYSTYIQSTIRDVALEGASR